MKKEIPAGIGVPTANQMREVKTRSNRAFYNSFLHGEISDLRRLPPWVLPKMVLEGRLAAAEEFAGRLSGESTEEKGLALEWALVALKGQGLKATQKVNALYESIRRPNRTEKIEELEARISEMASLKKKLLNDLDGLCIRQHYSIKTPWIEESVVRLWV